LTSAPYSRASSVRCWTPRTCAPGTRRASARLPAGTTTSGRPDATAAATAGSTPRTGWTRPSRRSSPRWTARPARSASGRLSAPRQATAMARSKAEPALGSEAGERLTVRRRASQGSPQDVTAARTRSRASDSDASGSPTRMKAGSPLAACASTWTRCPSTPTRPTDHVRARPTSAHRPQVLDEGGAPVAAQHRDDVDAYLGGARAVLAQPAPGEPPQPLELDGADGLRGVAEAGTAAGLDLDEGD